MMVTPGSERVNNMHASRGRANGYFEKSACNITVLHYTPVPLFINFLQI